MNTPKGRPRKLYNTKNRTSKNCYYDGCRSYNRSTRLNCDIYLDHDYCFVEKDIVFYPFAKPCLIYRKGEQLHNILECEMCNHASQWLNNCNRKGDFSQITKNRYVCSLHFVDNGPTEANPFPINHSTLVLEPEHVIENSKSEVTPSVEADGLKSATYMNNYTTPRRKCSTPVLPSIDNYDDNSDLEVARGRDGSKDSVEKDCSIGCLDCTQMRENNQGCDSSVRMSLRLKRPNSVGFESTAKKSRNNSEYDASSICSPLSEIEISLSESLTSPSMVNTKSVKDARISVDIKKTTASQTSKIRYRSIKTMFSPSTLSKWSQTSEDLVAEVENLKKVNSELQNKLDKCTCEVSKSKMHAFNDFESKMTKDPKMCFFYTGLYFSQILALFAFLGPSVNKLKYWNGAQQNEKNPNAFGRNSRFSPLQQLILTLIRLRCGFLEKDIAYRFNLSKSTVNSFVTTWIIFMYKEFQTLVPRMFPSRAMIQSNLPTCFRKHQNVRVIIDCTEFYSESSSNFEQQGNMYSQYKSGTTWKVLFGTSPTGAVTFISKAYEGAISDKELFVDSGLKDLLQEGDVVMADRGFTIADCLFENKVSLNIPPFLHGRDRFTPQEELLTKEIAKLRIFVEHSIGRVKRWRILKRKIPLPMAGIFSELVFVVGCLVNFQTPVVKY